MKMTSKMSVLRSALNRPYQCDDPVKSCGKLFSENAVIRREVRFGNSRFDLYVEDGEKRAFIEVKGVTLEKDGTAMFPDAPTERGVKHINELISAVHEGYETYILFVIQMKEIDIFKPNRITHPDFADALIKAESEGVHIMAVDCIVTPNSIEINSSVKVEIK